ncbi:hypothetical protein LguiB_031711 [Lonicera macranthoides]
MCCDRWAQSLPWASLMCRWAQQEKDKENREWKKREKVVAVTRCLQENLPPSVVVSGKREMKKRIEKKKEREKKLRDG